MFWSVLNGEYKVLHVRKVPHPNALPCHLGLSKGIAIGIARNLSQGLLLKASHVQPSIQNESPANNTLMFYI